MKTLVALVPVMLCASAFAADMPAKSGASAKAAAGSEVHRYVVERTFPKGALEGLNSEGKAKVNANNSKFGVEWVTSYATDDKTKTYCIYKAPNEAAVREAAKANGIPVDKVTEVPVTLSPQ
jgi:hypothetical protein